jgi:hypothetical protein
VSLPFAESEVPIGQGNQSLWGIHHRKLDTPRLLRSPAKAKVMRFSDWPSGQYEIPVPALPIVLRHLIQARFKLEAGREECRLVVAMSTACVAGDFLQANQIRILVLDDANDAVELITAVNSANPFINIVTGLRVF